MENIPKIKVKKNINTEVDLFLKFLHHPYYPQSRIKIFQSFPELEFLLKNQKNEKEEKIIIQKFIKKFYKKHYKIIQKIINNSKQTLKEKSHKVLKELANLMDYRWPKNHPSYTTMPTILPFSPFDNNTFYFSILGQIKGKNDKNVLFIATHEISHFIFFDILKKIKQEIKKSPPDDLRNYFKEALTAILLNRKPLCDILNFQDYKGNPEIRDLRIKKPDNMIVSFSKFINEQYETIKIKDKKSFESFLKEILIILLPINKEFSKKRAIWNKYGNQLFKNTDILHRYQMPIKIKLKKRAIL